MAGYEKTVRKTLKKNGFSVERNPRGSHVIWSNGQIEVSVPAKIKSRHTANGIFKQANIRKKV
ncbi:MAG: type II toxin-antitoxin system HicA family toxin [Bacteroidota bacterium]|nr:type II toxin-antitoxin system HicA family toxin [Bacteroidota bacterium]